MFLFGHLTCRCTVSVTALTPFAVPTHSWHVPRHEQASVATQVLHVLGYATAATQHFAHEFELKETYQALLLWLNTDAHPHCLPVPVSGNMSLNIYYLVWSICSEPKQVYTQPYVFMQLCKIKLPNIAVSSRVRVIATQLAMQLHATSHLVHLVVWLGERVIVVAKRCITLQPYCSSTLALVNSNSKCMNC